MGRRSSRFAVAAAALALLGTGSPAGGLASVSGAPPAPCEPDGSSHSAARAKPGTDGEDPASLSPADRAAVERVLQRRIQRMTQHGNLRGGAQLAAQKAYQVNTYVHVITRADGSGGVTAEQVAAQMQVLNQAFAGGRVQQGWSAGTPFRFVLKAVDHTANDDWYDWTVPEDGDAEESPEAEAAKQALHQGTFDDLNIYITGLVDYLGYAFFPAPDLELWRDGLVLLNDTLPGGALAPYNLGDTATHEIGHWLGLDHTFENGCAAPGDYVADTPYQLDGDNIFECTESLNTCRQPGRDPVHNYMSYGDDPCLDRFTTGQSLRMRQTWAAFRYRR